MTSIDPTRIHIATDPLTRRMTGVARHGNTPFSVPYISPIADNLWQGGCETGLVLPDFIKHVVSLYPWEKWTIHHEATTDYVEMYDSEDQGFEQVDALARLVNEYRKDGPTLANCQAGLNRSSLIAARALYLDGFGNGREILTHLRAARSPAVLCNPAFAAEVESWR